MYRLALLMALCAPSVVSAHASFDETAGVLGGYYTGFVRITHGCGASPTTSVRIEIPDNIVSVRPQPKPGWSITIDRTPLAQAVQTESGETQTERVAAITWTGALSAEHFDQFGLTMKLPDYLPDASGAIYFPTVQTCKEGENRWTEIPPTPEQWHEREFPSPMILLQQQKEGGH